MASSWSAIQECIRRAVAEALGLAIADGEADFGSVEWVGTKQANRFQNPETPWMVDIRMSPIVGKGRDEKRFTGKAVGAETTYGGYRLFNLQVSIRGMDQTPGADSVAQAGGRLRLRFRKPAIRAILMEQQIALVSIGATWNTDYEGDNKRQMSASVTEIRLATVEWETDVETDGGWIQHVRGNGHFEPNDVDVVLNVSAPDIFDPDAKLLLEGNPLQLEGNWVALGL